MATKSTFVNAAFFMAILTIVISASRACDVYNFNTVGLDDIPDDDAENNSTKHVNSWTGRLTRRAQNFTTLTLEWDAPTSSVVLCAYAVHFYPAKKVQEKSYHQTIHLPANKTDVVLAGLQIGTTYHIYVEAIFDRVLPDSLDRLQVLKSWLLQTSTLGYGSEDNPCNCDRTGTKNNDVNNCSPLDGQCKCKSEHMTSGRRCDQCAEKAYMNDELGCSACDQCDSAGSLGTCKPVTGGNMKCHCKDDFVGTHCRDCKFGYYPIGDHCEACNCSGNENTKSGLNWCTVNGTCAYCDNHTTGDHCELCYYGFVRDSRGMCILQTNSGHRAGIVILAIVVVFLVMILLLIFVRHMARRRRRGQLKQSSRDGGVNFTALEEEPDVKFGHGDRKLQFMGSTASS